jgi:hypothetical protein
MNQWGGIVFALVFVLGLSTLIGEGGRKANNIFGWATLLVFLVPLVVGLVFYFFGWLPVFW